MKHSDIPIFAFVASIPLLFFGGITMFFVYDSGWWLLASVFALILLAAG